MKRLSRILAEADASGVYLLAGTPRTDELEKLAAENTLAFFHVQGDDIRRKEELLQAVATALRFPEYFGNNWDAFEDCLRDMSWHPARGYLMVLDRFSRFADHAPDEFATALDILKDAAEFWSGQGKAMVWTPGRDGEKGGSPAVSRALGGRDGLEGRRAVTTAAILAELSLPQKLSESPPLHARRQLRLRNPACVRLECRPCGARMRGFPL